MTITQIIEDIVLNKLNVDGESFSFEYGDKGFQNLMADEELFPAVYLLKPMTSDDTTTPSGAIFEKYPVVLLFMYKSDLEFTPEQSEVLIDKSRLAKNQFLSALTRDARIKEYSSVKSLEFYHEFDADCDGVSMSLYITPQQQTSVCV